MKIIDKIKPYTILLIWNLALIALYISWECWDIFSPEHPFQAKIQIPFYFLELSYYCFATYIYLPYIFKKYNNNFIRLGFIIFLLGAYTSFYALFNTLLGSILYGKLVFEFPPIAWKMSSSRCIYILGISVGVWTGRYLILTVKKNALLKIQLSELKNQLILLENSFLKAQLSPHFMFNSLTSIYMRVVKQAPEVPEAILLLSQIMDYLLVNSKDDRPVNLIADLDNIEKTIELHKMLSSRKIYLNYFVEIDNDHFRIAPLLLLNLVDNIFKHGDLFDPSFPASIRVNLLDHKFHYHSTNRIMPEPSPTTRGIGLSNVRQRLNNIYPDRHRISATVVFMEFEVDLIILA